MANRRRQDSSRASALARKSEKSIGRILVQMPPGERKSGMPHSVEIPAPVNGSTTRDASTRRRRKSAAVSRSGAIMTAPASVPAIAAPSEGKFKIPSFAPRPSGGANALHTLGGRRSTFPRTRRSAGGNGRRFAERGLVAQVTAQDTAERRRDRAEQQRHETPEREVRRRLACRVGNLLCALPGAVCHLIDPLLRVVLAHPGACRHDPGQIGSIVA